MPGFNNIYWFYDPLAKLVFGNTLEKAKKALLVSIKEGSRILIIGGGTGKSLNYLDALGIRLHVDFVEVSEGMICKAKKRSVDTIHVDYYNATVEQFGGANYDFVITEFFLDLFDEKELKDILTKIKSVLKEDGQWIDVDFRKPTKIYHKVLLKTMLIFFKWSVQMKVDKLYDTVHLFSKQGMVVKKEISFMNGFVTSRLLSRF